MDDATVAVLDGLREKLEGHIESFKQESDRRLGNIEESINGKGSSPGLKGHVALIESSIRRLEVEFTRHEGIGERNRRAIADKRWDLTKILVAILLANLGSMLFVERRLDHERERAANRYLVKPGWNDDDVTDYRTQKLSVKPTVP